MSECAGFDKLGLWITHKNAQFSSSIFPLFSLDLMCISYYLLKEKSRTFKKIIQEYLSGIEKPLHIIQVGMQCISKKFLRVERVRGNIHSPVLVVLVIHYRCSNLNYNLHTKKHH